MASRRSPLCPGLRSSVRVGATTLAAVLALVIGLTFFAAPLFAQQAGNLMHFPPRPPPPPKKPAPPSNAPMLVQATEIRYDYTNNTVAAAGNVQIYY
ncbi:MAG: LPS-assembly protein LptD, partial [Xanthobacteraceae bacterium]